MSESTNLSRRAFSISLAAGLLAPAMRAVGGTQTDFPNRALRFIVPFPPGSGTDVSARMFAKKMGEMSGQSVVVENKPGGNGLIGVQDVLNAPADGYTIFIGSNSTLSTNVALFKKLPYDPLKDFTPITIMTRGPCVIIVPANSPYTTIQELISDARKRPGELNYGSGSISYKLYTEWFNNMFGIDATEIPYKGAGDAGKAVAGGEVDFAVVDGTGAVPLVTGGLVRGLAHADKERSSQMPDVPSAIEAGIPKYLAYNWVAAAVSSKTLPEVAKKIANLFMQVGNSADMREYYSHQQATLLVSSGEEMRRYQEEEIVRWQRLAELTKIPLM